MRQIETSQCDLMLTAEAGDPEAQYQLGVVFLVGDQVEQDSEAAFRWLAKAAAAQHASARSLVDHVAEWREAAAPAEKTWYSRKLEVLQTISPPAFATKLRSKTASSLRHAAWIFRSFWTRRLAVRIPIPRVVHDSPSPMRRGKAVQSLHPS
jgi:TPR repeat protein